MQKTCGHCGHIIQTTSNKQKYCSDCRNIVHEEQKRLRQTNSVGKCVRCGSPFERKQRGRLANYCSDDCRRNISRLPRKCERCSNEFETQGLRAKYCPDCRPIVNLDRSRETSAKRRAERKANCPTWNCERCGREFRSWYRHHRFCAECIPIHNAEFQREGCKKRRKEYRQSQISLVVAIPEYKRCWNCGEMKPESQFYRADDRPDGLQSRCIQCGRRLGKKYGGIRRARQSAAAYEEIDPIDILERDDWHCYVCGCETPKQLRGTYEDNAPQVDHIIPVARGGGWTYDNLACICRKHNGQKKDRTLEELGWHTAMVVSPKVIMRPARERNCHYCGNHLANSSKLYCSDNCRLESNRFKARDYYRSKHPIMLHKCKGCGEEFLPRHENQRYCSVECKR